MAFGIGINSEPASQGAFRGEYIKIACDCWFTASGRTIPHSIKFEDTEGRLITVNNIDVKSTENKNYAGVPSVEYICTIEYSFLRRDVKLVFFLEEKRWIMVLL